MGNSWEMFKSPLPRMNWLQAMESWVGQLVIPLFRVMPFGLCNAPGTFNVWWLARLHWSTCLVYLVDNIIFSITVEEHLTRLADVLTGLWKVGLKVKPSKCHLMKESVHFLGHVVSGEGVETDLTKIQCSEDWMTPSNAKELNNSYD